MMFIHSVLLLFVAAGAPFALDNDEIRLDLGFAPDGTPAIDQLTWANDKVALNAVEPASPLASWFPAASLPGSVENSGWRRADDAVYLRAETHIRLEKGLVATWVVELTRQGSIIRLHVRLSNTGEAAQPVSWYPVWNADWRVPGAESIRGWRALSFQPVEHALNNETTLTWHSRLHSSDVPDGGMNPYWLVGGRNSRLYVALDWCGGWKADITTKPETVQFRMALPPDETQLSIDPGETIDGPALMVAAYAQDNNRGARAAWFQQRAALAKTLYGGPAPAYPFVYNNWYTTRFKVDAAFIKRQLAALEPYHFDAFVVDAGWYAKVGDWTPDPHKFVPGEFESFMKCLDDQHMIPGIWTCPQFVNAPQDALPPEVDQPPTYEKFIDGHLLDLAGSDFTRRLVDHVAMLRDRYHAKWWKYDQLLFAANTRAGAMRNVLAFQNALRAVRKANPDLIIENCQSGGRMTNEFTVLSTQSQWLKDGGNTDIQHARDNIAVALGALEFVFPWAANRWTNNPDRMEPDNDEMTRYYCRSAMAGTWGLVADLANISERQRNVILSEVENYRKLNDLKKDYIYDIFPPASGADFAGIAYFAGDGHAAAVLLYRWDKQGSFDARVELKGMPLDTSYTVEDLDTRKTFDIESGNNLVIPFNAERMSALAFVGKRADH